MLLSLSRQGIEIKFTSDEGGHLDPGLSPETPVVSLYNFGTVKREEVERKCLLFDE